jgi:hypothetical protein
LALVLILAAQQSIRWARDDQEETDKEAHARIEQELAETIQDLGIEENPKYEADDGPFTDEQLKQIQELADKDLPTGEVIVKDELFSQAKDPHPPGWMWIDAPLATYPDNDVDVKEFIEAKEEAVTKNPIMVKAVGNNNYVEIDGKRVHHRAFDSDSIDANHAVARYIESLPVEPPVIVDKPTQTENDGNLWVPQPDGTWVNAGPMDQFDLGLSADNVPASATGKMRGFGTSFPDNSDKGDIFLRVDQLPSALYKFNGTSWIEVDKKLSDQYLYDEAYIDHLIEKIGTGEYDPELLSDAERESIEKRLIKKA